MRTLVAFALILFLSDACVDRLSFDVKDLDQGILVVDGQITDQPGPYVVRLFRSSSADDILNFAQPYNARKVTLLDDTGISEVLTSSGPGIFETRADGMRGEIGKKYHIQIELLDGTIFESKPDKMNEGGTIDSVYYNFESYLPIQGPTRYGFRVFMDASSNQNENFSRWKFTGTFSVQTFPERNYLFCNCCNITGPPDPLPCSGFIWTGTFLKRVGECTCCISYVNDFENSPHLNDTDIVTNGSFKKIEMGYVPFNEWTFSRGKYMLKVEQMSLSREAYEFWKIIRDQKEGATSLFQPSFGRTRTNMLSPNSEKTAVGFFYASSVQKKVLFISSSDATINVPDFDIVPADNCTLWKTAAEIFLNSSTVPPPEWE